MRDVLHPDVRRVADDDIEDDDIMFGSDDIDGVSKANADDLSKDDVDSIMSSWL